MYALWKWSPGAGLDMVHPEDREVARGLIQELGSISHLVWKVTTEGDWHRLIAGGTSLRMNGDGLQALPEPRFHVGDQVRDLLNDRAARVAELQWLRREHRYHYLLQVGSGAAQGPFEEENLARA